MLSGAGRAGGCLLHAVLNQPRYSAVVLKERRKTQHNQSTNSPQIHTACPRRAARPLRCPGPASVGCFQAAANTAPFWARASQSPRAAFCHRRRKRRARWASWCRNWAAQKQTRNRKFSENKESWANQCRPPEITVRFAFDVNITMVQNQRIGWQVIHQDFFRFFLHCFCTLEVGAKKIRFKYNSKHKYLQLRAKQCVRAEKICK